MLARTELDSGRRMKTKRGSVQDRPAERPAVKPSDRPAIGGLTGDTGGLGLDKPIYTLSVAAEILETHPRTLMMYEHLGMIKPRRTATNRRRYSQRDLLKLQVIQTLTREHGVNLAGVRYILQMLKILQTNGLEPPSQLAGIDVSEMEV
jgi:DNA-binding transcriptional MerR regulator